jgi:hypothetical protein
MNPAENSVFRIGGPTLRLYFIVLICASLLAAGGVFGAFDIAVAAGLNEKLAGKLTFPLQATFGIFAVWWALEAVHVRLSQSARALLSEMDEGNAGDAARQAAAFRRGDWILLVHQVVLGFACFAGFTAMMFVPGLLKQIGVKEPAAAAVTLLVWLSYIGPVLLAVFRFHHVGLTRDTRSQMATRLESLPSQEK